MHDDDLEGMHLDYPCPHCDGLPVAEPTPFWRPMLSFLRLSRLAAWGQAHVLAPVRHFRARPAPAK